MKALDPTQAEEVKRPIDAVQPLWRQVGGPGAEDPVVIVVEISGEANVIVAKSVFGAGHLDMTDWWQDGGHGATIMFGTAAIDQTGRTKVKGYIHFHRSFVFGSSALMTIQPGSPAAEAVKFFTEHEDEYSAFILVTFVRNGTAGRPWRAVPRTSA